jgi:mannose-6-phosphate isomerase-like protein (cupin superfamily)
MYGVAFKSRLWVNVLAASLVMTLVINSGCAKGGSASRGRVFSTDATLTDPAWTVAELAKPIAVRRLQATKHTSMNIIRLAGAEQPHMHRDHDLIVVVLNGTARVHLGEHVMDVRSGDIMEIPRGVVHWAENTGSEASEVYAIFSPPYDGLDHIPVSPVPLSPP